MKKGNFGENLRREREMRGVSLEEIAAATRISTRFLEALENEQWDRLPGGVFNRGFIRAVAHFLGLDEDSLIAEYALVTNDQPEVAVWADALPRPRRELLPWLAGLLLVVMLVGGWFGWRESRTMVTGWLSTLQKPAARPASAAAPAPTPQAPQSAQPNAAPGPLASNATSAATEPEFLELKVETSKTTDVKVIADGKTAFEGKLNAKDPRRFQARERFEVSSRDSFPLLLELNGQTLAPVGQPGEPGSITLTRKDLKKAQGGRN